MYKSTLHESDHKLVVSSLSSKIKVTRRQTDNICFQTTKISWTCRAGYRSGLAEVLGEFNRSFVNTLCDTLKSPIHKACKFLPLSPRSNHPDWIIDEVHSLSEKKKEVWVHLKNAPLRNIHCPKV